MGEVPLYLSRGRAFLKAVSPVAVLVLQGHLAHRNPPLGPPQGPWHGPTVGSWGGVVSYAQGTPGTQVCLYRGGLLEIKDTHRP